MKTKENIDLDKWSVLSFRITGFISSTGSMKNSETWWEKVTKSTPETELFIHAEKRKQIEGRFEKNWTTLNILPIRIDWNVGIHKDDQVTSDKLLTLGSFSDVIDSHITILAEQWFSVEDYPLMQRIALGVELVQLVDDRVSGYEVLNSLLPFEIDAKSSSDFLYQINRLRQSKVVSNLDINRLSKWTVQRRESMHFMVGPDTHKQVIHKEDAYYNVALLLDINSSSDYDGEFDSDTSKDVFGELLEFTKEIAIKGDIA